MNPRDRTLKDKAKALKAVMVIGKNGITQGSITLLDRELEQKGLVKVKLLANYLRASGRDRKEVAQELAALGCARLISLVGNVVVLYREKKG